MQELAIRLIWINLLQSSCYSKYTKNCTKKLFIYFHASHEGMSSPIWPILKEERSIKRRADFRGGVGGGGRGREGVCRGRGWGGAGERAYIFILVGRRSELNRRKS